MKLLRLLVVMVLSVMIPVNGFAAAPVSACPMQATDLAETTSASMDCCKDRDTPSPRNKCKPGQSCNLGGVYFALPASFQIELRSSTLALAYSISPYVSEQAASIWHPPKLF